MGRGKFINTTLQYGNHLITLNVSDSYGFFSEEMIEVMIIERTHISNSLNQTTDTFHPLLLILPIAFGIVIIAFIFFIVIRKRKRNNQNIKNNFPIELDQFPSQPNQNESSPQNDNSDEIIQIVSNESYSIEKEIPNIRKIDQCRENNMK